MSIKFDNLSFGYDKKNKILNNINLEISRGEFVSILGANGSGKTSLAYCMNGLIPHSFAGNLIGEVTINNVNLKKIGIGEIASKIGTVFQDPDLVIFNLTVEEEIAFGINNLKLDNAKERIAQALEAVGLEGFEERDPNTLSEGQKQKLCIASVLAMGTEYILLDEPISHLDYSNSIRIYELLKKLNESGKTIIVIEHDTDLVWDYSKRAILLHEGNIVKDGDAREILKNSDELKSLGIKPTLSYRSI